jgi:hypothetical protein
VRPVAARRPRNTTTLVREERWTGEVPLYRHPVWAEQFPWLAYLDRVAAIVGDARS